MPAPGQKLFFENFDGLPLGPNVEEASAGAQVWTKTPPAGWEIDDTGMPGWGEPDYRARDGMHEWAGWSFADVRWWPTVDDQRRSEFRRANGAAAIADPDEWDDADHYPGLFNSYLLTPQFNVAGRPANSLVMAFDSSWRPECCDDGPPRFPADPDTGERLNNQTAVITVEWDGGTPIEVMRWDSKADSETFKPNAVNEAVLVPLNNPAGAQNARLKFGMIQAANDWWWAFDNLAVGEPPMVAGVTASGVGFAVRVVEALGKTVSTTPAITARLNGQAVTVTREAEESDPDESIVGGQISASGLLVRYDQSPMVFAPRSTHTVELAYRSSDGRNLTDTVAFTAPGYVTVSATPSVVTASLLETTYLGVDESKGIRFELNGTSVTPQSVQRVDLLANDGSDAPDRIDARYSMAPQVFASGSSHTLKVIYTTRAGQELEETVTFTAPSYVTVPAALGTAPGTRTEPGMRWRTHQLATSRGTTIALTEQQLRGELGESIHDTSLEVSPGRFDIDFVNFEQNGGEAGRFRGSAATAELQIADDFIPGIPGLEGGNDNIAGEALAYLEIPAAGVYTMVVNSDDGFQVSVGNAETPTHLVLGRFDAGRGASDTVFYFRAEAPGVYLFRLLWFEGGGGASVEWFTLGDNGVASLVNGPDAASLKAYRRRTVAEPALPVAPAGISRIALQTAGVVIEYTGTLKRADQVTGPYTPVTGASSPYTAPPTGAQAYYLAD
ncbi:MAG: hypothetical protein KF833_20935 [Verrucomicrobiae bacterium]|nr:hypothetical protein [Verrucomicrobiae bacterium]